MTAKAGSTAKSEALYAKATTLIPADCKAQIDDFGNLLIQFK